MPIARRYLHDDEAEPKPSEKHRSQGLDSQHATVTAIPEYLRRAGVETIEGKDNDMKMPNGFESGREELIKRIKKEQRPQWLQTGSELSPRNPSSNHPSPDSLAPQQLLPSPELVKDFKDSHDGLSNHIAAVSRIARPRSALHTGDFRDPLTNYRTSGENKDILLPLSSRPQGQWLNNIPTVNHYDHQIQQTVEHTPLQLNVPKTPQFRNRAASYSAESSAFVFIPPTSPLAVQSNSADLSGGQEESLGRRSRSPDKSSRRRTFSPRALRAPQSASSGSHFMWPVPSLRQEKTFPYQAHQPRRSLSSFHNISSPSGAQTPSARSRRPSVSSDASPLQRAPMVGRYEESILRGRMSTVPSKPFDFVAQIGVMGKGKCRASLKCPPHITIPFPAVFYNYGSSRGSSTDGPSPYVGMVDIENFDRKTEQDNINNQTKLERSVAVSSGKGEMEQSRLDDHCLQASRPHRRDVLLRKPPGGSYRIPEQGQIQVVIKNPNKTAVKLFLVPYDLTGMEPGQKTFIRQRSYSAGPIIEMPISSRKNLGTDRPEAAISNSDDPNDRPVLRYLIHLQMCCTGKGRYYLYKSMRIVFANRVPDGKEKLRSETQLPEPRFSAYKPERRPTAVSWQSSEASAIDELKNMPGLRPTTPAGFGNTLYSFDETKHVPTGPTGPVSGSLRRPRTPVTQNAESFAISRAAIIHHSMDNDIVMKDSDDHFGSPRMNYLELIPTDSQTARQWNTTQHVFERRDRETYSSSSNGSSNQSPHAEGLISQQFRGWTEKRDS